jgi:hypothetical protein
MGKGAVRKPRYEAQLSRAFAHATVDAWATAKTPLPTLQNHASMTIRK